jgi:hypothetical protein
VNHELPEKLSAKADEAQPFCFPALSIEHYGIDGTWAHRQEHRRGAGSSTDHWVPVALKIGRKISPNQTLVVQLTAERRLADGGFR